MAFQFDLDWIAIIGAILLPIVLLIYSLLDMLISIGLNPVSCLKDLFEFVISLTMGIADQIPVIGQTATASIAAGPMEEVMGLAAGFGGAIHLTGHVNFPVNSTLLDEKMKGVMGKISSIEAFLMSLSSIQIGLPEIFNKIKKVLQMLIEMMSRGSNLIAQIMAVLMFIGRIIGFLKAIIELILSASICTDPTIPLSPSDVQAVIDKVNEQNNLKNSLEKIPGLSLTTELSFNQDTDSIVILDKFTNESKLVPTCLGKIKKEDQSKINDWVAELDAID